MSRAATQFESDVEAAFKAAQCVVETHRRLAEFIRPGVTLARIDAEVARVLKAMGCRSAFLGYRQGRLPPFPSHSCLSLNDCIVHGTAGYVQRPLERGDLLKLDIGVVHNGWCGDAAWTYAISGVTPENRRLMDCGKEALRRGIEQLRPGNTYMDWARTVQHHVETECGFRCVRGLGGHGYGRKLHTPPFVSNVVTTYPGEWAEAFKPCAPGTLLAVEPMLAVGTGETAQAPGEWPIVTADGSMSVHYEADVLITEAGPRDLTEGLSSVPDVLG